MWNEIELFIDKPHLFGHYLGYNDLIPIHSKWIKDAWLSKDSRAMQAHRNSYKTTSILIVGTIWYLLFFDRNASVVIIRKSDKDAQKVVDAIRQHLESKEVGMFSNFLYGKPNLKTDNWSKSSLTLSIKETKTPEGSIEAKGTTSAVTGSHYDFILPDDIISLKDRVSKAEREWIKEFVRELKNIVKEGGKIFFSGTPWHKDDAWSIMPEPDKYPIGTVPIKGYTKDKLDKKIESLKSGNTMSMYSANYELKHISDEESLFSEPVYGKWPDDFNPRAYLDPAYSGDNTVGLSIGGEHEGKYYSRGYVWEDNIVNLYSDIIQVLKLNKVGTLTIETNADKGLSKIEFEKLWPSVDGKHEKENKHIRIVTFAVKYFDQFIWHPKTDINYMAQVLDYREGEEPDDAPDSLAGLIRELGFVDDNEVYVGVA